ncbi:hypothetical protein FAES_3987 [Fibrella aestuarina BUZ 2]|uniref:Phage head-tail adaptor n=1 Tax=Fibrella aestuarina BUZ 2 TaxID=1166018 RepID=I0KCY5_9BACT|nr:hypothetical protein [Fibrella aestuarina]CCH01988.1 hypothetical protein FAES_3987 [Fibrella aestuarina BUZ 2]
MAKAKPLTSYNQPIAFKGVANPQPDGHGGQIGTVTTLAERVASIEPYRGGRDETGARLTLKRQYVIECWHDPAYLPVAGHTIDWLGGELTINEWTYLDNSRTKIRLIATEV